MKNKLSRRKFLKTSSAAAAAAAFSFNVVPSKVLGADAPSNKLNIAVVGVGARITLDTGGNCTEARIALGAVAPTVRRVADAEAALVGQPITDDTLAAVAAAASAACDPIDDKRGTIAYRKQVAGVLAKRAVKIAAERAAGTNNTATQNGAH